MVDFPLSCWFLGQIESFPKVSEGKKKRSAKVRLFAEQPFSLKLRLNLLMVSTHLKINLFTNEITFSKWRWKFQTCETTWTSNFQMSLWCHSFFLAQVPLTFESEASILTKRHYGVFKGFGRRFLGLQLQGPQGLWLEFHAPENKVSHKVLEIHTEILWELVWPNFIGSMYGIITNIYHKNQLFM